MTNDDINSIPKVSIGMPVFNGENYIRGALDSLLNQTYTNFELIISDNASTDTTEKICREYACQDSRITYFRQHGNIGMHSNWQFVFNKADGEYFMWACHDDEWGDEFISVCVERLINNPKIGMAFTRTDFIDTYGNRYRDTINFSSLSGRDTYLTIFRYLMEPEYFGKSTLIYSLFKRDFIYNIYNRDYFIRNFYVLLFYDTVLSLGVMALGGMEISDKILFRKRYQRPVDQPDKVDYIHIIYWIRFINIHYSLPVIYILNSFIAVKGTKYYWLTVIVMFYRFIESIIFGATRDTLKKIWRYFRKLRNKSIEAIT